LLSLFCVTSEQSASLRANLPVAKPLTGSRTNGSVAIASFVANHYFGEKHMSGTKKVNLEKSLADLENLVEELESGDLPLEKAMKKFEEGIKLTRNCQSALRDAEQKVEILLKSADGESLEDFAGEE